MSAKNGGRGKPPTPPQQQKEIAIEGQVIRQSRQTNAERTDNGLAITFVVPVNGAFMQHTYLIGERGRDAIRDAITGGLEVASEMPAEG